MKTAESGGSRGFDGHTIVKGRKRHILVDTRGLLVAETLIGITGIRLMLGRLAT